MFKTILKCLSLRKTSSPLSANKLREGQNLIFEKVLVNNNQESGAIHLFWRV